jgi:hypothetical protein
VGRIHNIHALSEHPICTREGAHGSEGDPTSLAIPARGRARDQRKGANSLCIRLVYVENWLRTFSVVYLDGVAPSLRASVHSRVTITRIPFFLFWRPSHATHKPLHLLKLRAPRPADSVGPHQPQFVVMLSPRHHRRGRAGRRARRSGVVARSRHPHTSGREEGRHQSRHLSKLCASPATVARRPCRPYGQQR